MVDLDLVKPCRQGLNFNNNNTNSILIYLRANLTAQRPITKLAIIIIIIIIIIHVKWVPWHHGTESPQVSDGGDGLTTVRQ
jgi:hypothetical protein